MTDTFAPDPAAALARLILRTLDAQQDWFRRKQGFALCQELESELRAAAAADGTELGELALRVLDRQRGFYATRDRNQLTECKQLERRLREAAHHALHPPQVQPLLFGSEA